jgi:L,D-peptidoglycan transpeptidase YkuD (ErfK/YbiS/YcfS/YnhG family)
VTPAALEPPRTASLQGGDVPSSAPRARSSRSRNRSWAVRTTLASVVALGATLLAPVSVSAVDVSVPGAPAVHGSALPGGLHVPGAGQVVLVVSASASSSHATLLAFENVHGRWARVFAPMAARVGRNGWIPASRRREGDGTTPEGVFAMGSTIYGNGRDPGVRFRYHRLVPGDYWDENPSAGRAYNTFVHSSDTDCASNPLGGDSECLWLDTVAYRYFAVVDFNTPARGPYGSAIFLHVTIGATAGCVTVSLPNLVRLLRWLHPGQHPKIVLAGPMPLRKL